MKKTAINKKTIIFFESEVLSNINDKELESLRKKLRIPVWKIDKSYENIFEETVNREISPSLFLADKQYLFGCSFQKDLEIIVKEKNEKFLDELVCKSEEIVTNEFILLGQ